MTRVTKQWEQCFLLVRIQSVSMCVSCATCDLGLCAWCVISDQWLKPIHQCVIIVKQIWVILLIEELRTLKFKNSDMYVCAVCVQSFTGDARRLWWVFAASFWLPFLCSVNCRSTEETLVFEVFYYNWRKPHTNETEELSHTYSLCNECLPLLSAASIEAV